MTTINNIPCMSSQQCVSNDHSSEKTSLQVCDDIKRTSKQENIKGKKEGFSYQESVSETCVNNSQHVLRKNWQFWRRPRENSNKSRSSVQDWKKELAPLGNCIKTVEQFWEQVKSVLEYALDENVFMFRENIKPMWEDPVFENGGSVCLSFSGTAYQENSRQTFLLCCLMLIGAQFVEQEQYLYGCVLSWKAGLCRVELWTSLDDLETLKLITKQIFSIMNQFHKEFYRNYKTRIRYEWKAFKCGGEKQLKVNSVLEDILNDSFDIE